jgi:ATP-dependent Zn protease
MLAAMPVGSQVATVVSNLKTLLVSKASDADASDPPALDPTTNSEAALWGLQLVQDLDDYRAGRLQWQDVDRGCVLAGLPGTGKTLLVHSIASAAKIPLVKCSIVELFAGDSYLHTTIANIKRAFVDAARLRPCILFFDELDSLPRRSSSGRGRNDDYWSALTAAFLLLLDDGTSRREGVVVIGATNRPDVLDDALLRPGRFEKIIEVLPPNEYGRDRVLRHHLRSDLADADLSNAVKLTAGMTPADLMELVRIAKRRARHLGRPLEQGDLSKALELRSLTDERQRRVAIHEAGHGIIARSLSELRLLDISLIVADGKLGSARFEAKTDGRDGMEALATALLGGMAAEMEVFGDIGSGAGIGETSDLARATGLLTAVHATLGMAENLVWRGDGKSASALLNSDPDLRAAVQSDLRRVLARARDLIRGNINAVHRVADALVKQLVLSNDDITAIMQSSAGSSGPQP